MALVVFEFFGLVTLAISVVGIVVALKHAFFLRKPHSLLSEKLSRVFFSDAGLYFITGVFGVLGFLSPVEACLLSRDFNIEADLGWFIAFSVRIPLLAINIIASWQLYQHYRMIH